ncbi:MAG: 7-carboxy-7-deazaguanine synthase QueE [Crenarchaeota archaeon]|nr:7-carboxy-7-deazaguanine synthase QueE [Thermoproteota archaeon]
MSRLEVSEIFTSFQGEGPLAGRRAIFLRLARCNLRCTWCDTKYAYEPRYVLTIDQVRKIILKYRESMMQERPLLVVTGGEPLIQKRGLRSLLESIKEMFVTQLETNGTIDVSDIIELFDYVVVSPKLASSGNPPELRKISPTYRKVLEHYSDRIFFKFVIDRLDDIYEVESIVRELNISRGKVFLMPQCRSMEEHVEKLRLVYKLALMYNYSISVRLQYVLDIR